MDTHFLQGAVSSGRCGRSNCVVKAICLGMTSADVTILGDGDGSHVVVFLQRTDR